MTDFLVIPDPEPSRTTAPSWPRPGSTSRPLSLTTETLHMKEIRPSKRAASLRREERTAGRGLLMLDARHHAEVDCANSHHVRRLPPHAAARWRGFCCCCAVAGAWVELGEARSVRDRREASASVPRLFVRRLVDGRELPCPHAGSAGSSRQASYSGLHFCSIFGRRSWICRRCSLGTSFTR